MVAAVAPKRATYLLLLFILRLSTICFNIHLLPLHNIFKMKLYMLASVASVSLFTSVQILTPVTVFCACRSHLAGDQVTLESHLKRSCEQLQQGKNKGPSLCLSLYLPPLSSVTVGSCFCHLLYCFKHFFHVFFFLYSYFGFLLMLLDDVFCSISSLCLHLRPHSLKPDIKDGLSVLLKNTISIFCCQLGSSALCIICEKMGARTCYYMSSYIEKIVGSSGANIKLPHVIGLLLCGR